MPEQFKLNIEATKKFDPFRFNESWINYRRTSGALTVKCQGDRLYASGLKCLLRRADYNVVTKEGMSEGNYNGEFLKFLYHLGPNKFQGSVAIKNKFSGLIKKDEEN